VKSFRNEILLSTGNRSVRPKVSGGVAVEADHDERDHLDATPERADVLREAPP